MPQDIEDLSITCPKTKKPCAGTCPKSSRNTISISFREDKQWYKVFELSPLYDLLEKSGNKPYMLVAGNTAHGMFE